MKKFSKHNSDIKKVLLEPLKELSLKEDPQEKSLNPETSVSEPVDLQAAKYIVSIPPIVNPWKTRTENLKDVKTELSAFQTEAKLASNTIVCTTAQMSTGSFQGQRQLKSANTGSSSSKKLKKSKQQNKDILSDGQSWPTLDEAMNARQNSRSSNASQDLTISTQTASKMNSNSLTAVASSAIGHRTAGQLKKFTSNTQKQIPAPAIVAMTNGKSRSNRISSKRTQKSTDIPENVSDGNQSATLSTTQANLNNRSRFMNGQPRPVNKHLHPKMTPMQQKAHLQYSSPMDISSPILYSLTPFTYIDDISALEQMIRQQIEYYFSVENLCRDIYFRRQMDQDGFVDINIVANFPRIRTMTSDTQLIRRSLLSSNLLEVQDFRVRRKEDWRTFLLPFQPQQIEIPMVMTSMHAMMSTIPFHHSFTSVSDADLNNYYMMTSGQVTHSSNSSNSEIDHAIHYDGNNNTSLQSHEKPHELYFPLEDDLNLSDVNKTQCIR